MRDSLQEFVDRGRAAQEGVDRLTGQKVQRRAAIYVRVSTGEQSAAMQLRDLEEYCGRRSWQQMVFEDQASGSSRKRPGLEELMKQARRRSIDVVVVWRFDRFARSLAQLVGALEEFRELGIDFVSLHEQIDTTTAMGRLIFQISAAFAEFEREIIRERVRGGLRNARAKGKRLGRPSVVGPMQAGRIREMRQVENLSWSQIQARVRLPIRTIRRVAQGE
jgi:DNA invertase Pin-like site-specific DNA recombinase